MVVRYLLPYRLAEALEFLPESWIRANMRILGALPDVFTTELKVFHYKWGDLMRKI